MKLIVLVFVFLIGCAVAEPTWLLFWPRTRSPGSPVVKQTKHKQIEKKGKDRWTQLCHVINPGPLIPGNYPVAAPPCPY